MHFEVTSCTDYTSVTDRTTRALFIPKLLHRLTVSDHFNNRLCANITGQHTKIYCSFTGHINVEFPASWTEMSDELLVY